MSETKFAPGPYRVVHGHPLNACLYLHDSDGHEVAVLYGGQDSGAEADEDGRWSDQPIRDATAHLLSASADLVEALQYCVERDPGLKAHANVMAALSKASGKGE
ncbi:hypothetical protein V5F49_20330 [Xanthobacter sp. V3C-3]|uniref:hypothetical protein n=1 Tax=Xanthobacter lutulentifluminis TaxID=3119935 RepID=UPI0037277EB4